MIDLNNEKAWERAVDFYGLSDQDLADFILDGVAKPSASSAGSVTEGLPDTVPVLPLDRQLPTGLGSLPLRAVGSNQHMQQ